MNKYFSMDIKEYPAEIKFHSTLEEARAACLNSALDAFELALLSGIIGGMIAVVEYLAFN